MQVKLFLATIAFSMFSTVANANPDASLVYMMQFTLNDHGFGVGNPDGRIGPATKKGLAEFASEYGIPDNAEDVINHMLNLSSASRVPVTDEKMLSIIKDEVADTLLDPDSIMLRDVYLIESAFCKTVVIHCVGLSRLCHFITGLPQDKWCLSVPKSSNQSPN